MGERRFITVAMAQRPDSVGWFEWQDLSWINDYIIDRVSYDHERARNLVAYQSPEATLRRGLGVCMDYAALFEFLGRRSGYTVRSMHSDGLNHAWNEVFLGGHWWIVDVTWNDGEIFTDGTAVPVAMRSDPDFRKRYFLTTVIQEERLLKQGLLQRTHRASDAEPVDYEKTIEAAALIREMDSQLRPLYARFRALAEAHPLAINLRADVAGDSMGWDELTYGRGHRRVATGQGAGVQVCCLGPVAGFHGKASVGGRIGDMKSSTFGRLPLVALALSVTAPVLLTGCGSSVQPSPSEPADLGTDGVVIVTNSRANVPIPRLSPGNAELITQALRRELPVTVVSADGTPELVRIAIPKVQGANEQAYNKRLSQALQTVQLAITALPNSDGADAYDALALARDSARAARMSRPTIICLQCGLDTYGPLAMTGEGAVRADPKDFVEHLTSTKQLVTFDGFAQTTVVLTSVGQTAPPQKTLNGSDRENLTAIWQVVLKGRWRDSADRSPARLRRLRQNSAHGVGHQREASQQHQARAVPNPVCVLRRSLVSAFRRRHRPLDRSGRRSQGTPTAGRLAPGLGAPHGDDPGHHRRHPFRTARRGQGSESASCRCGSCPADRPGGGSRPDRQGGGSRAALPRQGQGPGFGRESDSGSARQEPQSDHHPARSLLTTREGAM